MEERHLDGAADDGVDPEPPTCPEDGAGDAGAEDRPELPVVHSPRGLIILRSPPLPRRPPRPSSSSSSPLHLPSLPERRNLSSGQEKPKRNPREDRPYTPPAAPYILPQGAPGAVIQLGNTPDHRQNPIF